MHLVFNFCVFFQLQHLRLLAGQSSTNLLVCVGKSTLLCVNNETLDHSPAYSKSHL